MQRNCGSGLQESCDSQVVVRVSHARIRTTSRFGIIPGIQTRCPGSIAQQKNDAWGEICHGCQDCGMSPLHHHVTARSIRCAPSHRCLFWWLKTARIRWWRSHMSVRDRASVSRSRDGGGRHQDSTHKKIVLFVGRCSVFRIGTVGSRISDSSAAVV